MRAGLEICVDDVAGIDAAVAGGADRIELCAALALDGLTPSWGLLRHGRACGLPVFAMVRLRGGTFACTPAEVARMAEEIVHLADAGAAGLVFGVSRPDGALDAEALATLRAAAGDLPYTLHRAFDGAPDLDAALETAVALGFARVLTAGGGARAIDRTETLARLVARAGARLTILPGGGVRSENAAAVLAATGAREIHSSARPAGAATTSAAEVAALARIVRDAGAPG